MTPLLHAVSQEIGRHGPLPVDRVLELALYDETRGFYETGGAAGRRNGDFLTSPEVGPLFGAVVARVLDAQWRDLGSPNPFVVVEAGAGPGTLCRTILAAGPECATALRYVLVERSAALRGRLGEQLTLEDPALAFPPVDSETELPVPEAPAGPICVSLAELPRVAGPVIVLANELLDNLAFGLAEWRDGRWWEVRVDSRTVGVGARRTGAAGASAVTTTARLGTPKAFVAGSGGLVERLVPLDDGRAETLDRLVPAPGERARVPLQVAAAAWLHEAVALASPGGRVVAIDYATTTAAMAVRPQEEWLRTYRGHAPAGAYLDDLGGQDVMCEVAVDQLAAVRVPTSDVSQGEWLAFWGIDELVEEGRRIWRERAHIGDLEAVAARSRVSEAEALSDPSGLGAFRVLEWAC